MCQASLHTAFDAFKVLHFALWQGIKGAYKMYIELRRLLVILLQHIRSDLLAGQRTYIIIIIIINLSLSQLQLQTTPDPLHLVMNVDNCTSLARRYVADTVASGEPMSLSISDIGHCAAVLQSKQHLCIR